MLTKPPVPNDFCVADPISLVLICSSAALMFNCSLEVQTMVCKDFIIMVKAPTRVVKDTIKTHAGIGT